VLPKETPPPIATTTARFAVLPSPSCRCALHPQQRATPEIAMAPVWKSPALTLRKRSYPPAATGDGLASAVPLPSCPSGLAPGPETGPG
jgi:hypothetical protein